MNKDIPNEVKEDLDPILDLFGGADGGSGFAKLRHVFLPKIYKRESDSSLELIEMIKRFSRLCEIMLKEN